MPLTMVDSIPALIVIDLQKGIVGVPTVHPVAEIVNRSAQLARAFRDRRSPVVLVNVTGPAPGRTDLARPQVAPAADWAELVPELEQQPGDHLVSKQRVGAFFGTDLDEYLRKRGVTQVFVIGIATSGGVAATARSAQDAGYNVVLVTDAMTDRDAETHRVCVERIFPRMAETDSTSNVLHLLRG